MAAKSHTAFNQHQGCWHSTREARHTIWNLAGSHFSRCLRTWVLAVSSDPDYAIYWLNDLGWASLTPPYQYNENYYSRYFIRSLDGFTTMHMKSLACDLPHRKSSINGSNN